MGGPPPGSGHRSANRNPKDNLDLSINGFALVAYVRISTNWYAEMLQKMTRDTDVNCEYSEMTVN